MVELKKCRACGLDVQSNAPFGHCPKCLLEFGFGPAPEDSAEEPVHGTKVRYFADYELLEEIGRGGMGTVYKARQESLNRIVALKMISAGEFAPPSVVQRFQIEAEATAKLDHPNIVPIYEVGFHRGQRCFSMKFIEGRSLSEEIRNGKFRSVSREKSSGKSARQELTAIARLMATVARSVHFAHQHGILHRDLKPANILLDAEGQPHLTDFGLAEILEHDLGVTGSNEVLGTLSYMSPGHATGKPATRASDIYSLGVILYELLTGGAPFRADTPLETLRRVTEDEPTHPRTVNRRADSELAAICLKSLEKDPLRRYASAEMLAEDLERWLRDEPIHARQADPLLRINRWMRRNRAGSGLIAVLCLTLAIVLVLLGWVYREQRAKRDALQVLQRDVSLTLAELWTNSLQRHVTISSDKLAALREDQPAIIQRGVGSLDLLFAVHAREEPGKMLTMMAPILATLERSMASSLSRPVRIDLRIYRQDDDAQAALVGGEVHFMRVGSSSYIEAKMRNPRLSLLARQNGRIRGYIFANAEAGIRSNSLAALKGNPSPLWIPVPRRAITCPRWSCSGPV